MTVTLPDISPPYPASTCPPDQAAAYAVRRARQPVLLQYMPTDEMRLMRAERVAARRHWLVLPRFTDDGPMDDVYALFSLLGDAPCRVTAQLSLVEVEEYLGIGEVIANASL